MIKTKSLHTDLVNMQPILLRFELRLTADHDDALDLLQDTNLKVLENSHRYVPDTNFRSWVLKIMQNTYFNNYQRSRHPLAQTDSLDAHYKGIVSRADESMSPQQCCETLEIKNAIRSLRSDHRVAFSLLVYGFRYREISKITGSSEIIVKNNIALARRSLHSSLAAYRV